MHPVHEKLLERQVALQIRLVAFSGRNTLSHDAQRASLVSGLLLGPLAAPALALAACEGAESVGALQELITRAGYFLVALGGVLAVFMTVLGGFRIIAGHKEESVAAGMKNVKNAMIGLAIMMLGYFIPKVVAAFTTGISSDTGNTGECVDFGLKG